MAILAASTNMNMSMSTNMNMNMSMSTHTPSPFENHLDKIVKIYCFPVRSDQIALKNPPCLQSKMLFTQQTEFRHDLAIAQPHTRQAKIISDMLGNIPTLKTP